MSNVLAVAGDVTLFGLRGVKDAFRRPFEGEEIRRQLIDVGSKSVLLVIVSGFALGAVLTMHTRSTLITFGATAWIPSVQALAFFLEIGPLVTGLLVSGRVGSGIGAVLSNMRATEQIDAIECRSFGFDGRDLDCRSRQCGRGLTLDNYCVLRNAFLRRE